MSGAFKKDPREYLSTVKKISIRIFSLWYERRFLVWLAFLIAVTLWLILLWQKIFIGRVMTAEEEGLIKAQNIGVKFNRAGFEEQLRTYREKAEKFENVSRRENLPDIFSAERVKTKVGD